MTDWMGEGLSEWMTAGELARLLNVELHTIYAFHDTGKPVAGKLIERLANQFRAHAPPQKLLFSEPSYVFAPYMVDKLR